MFWLANNKECKQILYLGCVGHKYYPPGLLSIFNTLQNSGVKFNTPGVLRGHTKLELILTPVGVSLIPLGVKFNTGGCYSNTYQCLITH